MDKLKTIRRLHCRFGQSAVEYFIIMCVVLVAVLSSRIIERVRDGFKGYFNNAAAHTINCPTR